MSKRQTRFITTVSAYDLTCEATLCLCAYKDDHYYPSGTATMIGPLLAITARHVVEDYFVEYDHVNFDSQPKQVNAGFTVMAIHHASGATWEVNKFYFLHERPDIVFIHLKFYDMESTRVKIKTPIVDLSIPQSGEKIYAFGYIEPQNEEERNSDNKIAFGMDGNATRIGAYSEGTIIEVHESYRDKGRLNFPCFQTNARFDGGMSGGPIFNDHGKLIGLVCSNLPPCNANEDHVSYGTLIYPSMIIPIAIPYPKFESKLPSYPAYWLFREGIISTEGWDKYELLLNDENQRYETIISAE